MEEEIIKIDQDKIMAKIFLLRGQKVMLDRDLASLYAVQAIRLREQVKRNSERFPANFMFQLTEIEVDSMVSQNAIPSKSHLGGALPYVFTEHGILMLANVLRSEQAIKMSIRIIEIFIKMREFVSGQKDVLLKIETIERKIDSHDDEIKIIFNALRELIQTPQKSTTKIGFKQSTKK